MPSVKIPHNQQPNPHIDAYCNLEPPTSVSSLLLSCSSANHTARELRFAFVAWSSRYGCRIPVLRRLKASQSSFSGGQFQHWARLPNNLLPFSPSSFTIGAVFCNLAWSSTAASVVSTNQTRLSRQTGFRPTTSSLHASTGKPFTIRWMCNLMISHHSQDVVQRILG